VIADLESYLDGSLFNRSTRQVQLTDFSKQFCRKYKPCYNKASSFSPFPGNKTLLRTLTQTQLRHQRKRESSLHLGNGSAGCFFHLVETPLSGCIK